MILLKLSPMTKVIFKFWKLHSFMNRAKKHADIPDFRREDVVWVHTEAEKGQALFEIYLTQTDQRNATETKGKNS